MVGNGFGFHVFLDVVVVVVIVVVDVFFCSRLKCLLSNVFFSLFELNQTVRSIAYIKDIIW